MASWRELILRYHTHFKIKTLVVHDCPLWKKKEIGRELSAEGIAVVVMDFIKSGYCEWEALSMNFIVVGSPCKLLFLQNVL